MTEDFEVAIHGKKRTTSSAVKKLDGEQEAKVIALRLSDPPKGRNGWTLRLLAEKVVELEIIPEVSYPTNRRTLKKHNNETESAILGHSPKSRGEFVASMEAVLETYGFSWNPRIPVLMMDEHPVQPFRETRTPIPATIRHARRVDNEYERAGVANIFMFSDSLCCWRRTIVRERKTKIDWALEARILSEEDYPDAEKIRLVCENLNTHSLGSVLRKILAEPCKITGETFGDYSDAKARQLAEHCGKGIVGIDGSMCEGMSFLND